MRLRRHAGDTTFVADDRQVRFSVGKKNLREIRVLGELPALSLKVDCRCTTHAPPAQHVRSSRLLKRLLQIRSGWTFFFSGETGDCPPLNRSVRRTPHFMLLCRVPLGE